MSGDALATYSLPVGARRLSAPGGWQRRLSQLVLHTGLFIWAFLAVYPLVWILLTSLKFTPELYADPFGLPLSFKWSNYQEAWVHAKMGRYFLNSLAVTLGSTVLVLGLSSTTAFVLARFD